LSVLGPGILSELGPGILSELGPGIVSELGAWSNNGGAADSSPACVSCSSEEVHVDKGGDETADTDTERQQKRQKTASLDPGPDSIAHTENSVIMNFYPRMPGNSCTPQVACERLRSSGCRIHGPDSPYLVGMTTERCVVKTLTDVIDEYVKVQGQRQGQRQGQKIGSRISLLKVDVEGSELGVLLSLEARLWQLVDQVVVETARPAHIDTDLGETASKALLQNLRQGHEVASRPPPPPPPLSGQSAGQCDAPSNTFFDILNLLEDQGFKVSVEWDPVRGHDTGCVMLYGTR
jgi:hypothetical protein